MHVTVTFHDVDTAVLNELLSSLGTTGVITADAPATGWTADRAETLIDDLAPRQADLLLDLARSRTGTVDAADVRVDGGTLKGLTGPISKAVNRLAAAGHLHASAESPVEVAYDPAIRSYQRARSFSLRPDAIEAFKEAARRYE